MSEKGRFVRESATEVAGSAQAEQLGRGVIRATA
jgi:hypothetical protein